MHKHSVLFSHPSINPTQIGFHLNPEWKQVTPVGPNLVPREPSNGQPATTKARRSTPEADGESGLHVDLKSTISFTC